MRQASHKMIMTLALCNMKKILLTGKYGQGKHTLVSDEDFPILSKHRWGVNTYGYVVRKNWDKETKIAKTVYMQKEIMNTQRVWILTILTIIG